MSRFVNDETGVTVVVSDDKDDRFTSGWHAEVEQPAKTADRKPAARKTSEK